MWVNACAPLTTPGRSDPYRIVVDVEASFEQPGRERAPVVVLDPGHGGDEPGAANARYDLVEATLALQIAKLAARGLRERLPDAHVLLTREGGRRLRFDTSQCECRSGSHRLEASFLSHDPEARALTTLRYRRALADGIASGIVDYLHSR